MPTPTIATPAILTTAIEALGALGDALSPGDPMREVCESVSAMLARDLDPLHGIEPRASHWPWLRPAAPDCR